MWLKKGWSHWEIFEYCPPLQVCGNQTRWYKIGRSFVSFHWNEGLRKNLSIPRFTWVSTDTGKYPFISPLLLYESDRTQLAALAVLVACIIISQAEFQPRNIKFFKASKNYYHRNLLAKRTRCISLKQAAQYLIQNHVPHDNHILPVWPKKKDLPILYYLGIKYWRQKRADRK